MSVSGQLLFRIASCMTLMLFQCGWSHGHELLDGEVDRRVQISVKPDAVLVEYSLAMNDSTMQRIIKEHHLKPAAEFPDRCKQLQEIGLQSLPTRMLLSLDGKKTVLKPVRGSYSGWSHPHLSVLLRADIRLSDQKQTVVIADRNFPNASGDYRIAIKGRSGAILEGGSARSLVSKVEPVRWEKLTDEQKSIVSRVQAEFYIKPPATGDR